MRGFRPRSDEGIPDSLVARLLRRVAGGPADGPSVALVADELTHACLTAQTRVRSLCPLTYKLQLKLHRPDLLLVESAWNAGRGAWKYKIARYPDHPRRTNAALRDLVNHARDLGIPTVFWNKEDSVHFDRFIDSAKLFDHVFTVDSNCIPRYKAVMGPDASVHTLMFPVQPATHHFTGFDFKHRCASFVGSYSHHIHARRRQWQDMAFEAASGTGLGLAAYDRNSNRKAAHYRYPALPGLTVQASVPHAQTAQLYKDYVVSLNVNTVEDSPTMYSRRLVEILACGGIVATSPALSVDTMFKDFCHVISTPEEARELFGRLRRDGPSADDLERARAGADYVLRDHTWARRLQRISSVVGL
jgi:hypothetical protein